MTLLASLLAAVAAYAAAGLMTGNPVQWPSRKPRPRSEVSDRQLWLIQAGSRLTTGQFIARSAGLGLLALILGTMVTGTWWLAIMPAVGAALLMPIHYGRRRNQRLRELRQAWPDALRDLLASVAAGATLVIALHDLAERGPLPLRAVFGRFRSVARMVGVVPALEMVKEELGDPTSDRVLEVLVLAYQHGGGLVTEVLRDLAGEITEDLRLDAEIRSYGTEQRIESRVVVVIPWLLLLFLTATAQQYRIYYQSADGLVVVGVAIVWSLVGLWLMKRIGRPVTEKRVLSRTTTGGEPGGAG